MAATIADIIRVMEARVPLHLAEDWDNVGLQVGKMDWPVRSIWIALDPLHDVVDEACRNDVDLLITHHPLIFQPLKRIDFDTPVGSIIQMASRHRLAIYAAHTNLDSAADGINDVLASRIGLTNLNVLVKAKATAMYKLVVYVPAEYEQQVLDALFETKAGEIGSYTCCSFRSSGKGTFRPGSAAKPFVGKPDEISHTDEIRLETVVRREDLSAVIEHVRKNHPYETMAYDVYPLLPPETDTRQKHGIGRVGELGETTELLSFAQSLKKKLELKFVKVAGKPDLPVRQVAVCSGSGSSLMNAFFSSGAQVFISGDLRYHDAREAEAAKLALIDIGHFASEHLVLEALAQRLDRALSANGLDVKIEACRLENDPFIIV
ncbi:MAG: Nif3-like dinuclear metal center hexameric protein [Pseudomonadota bacterium]|uniref:GTP cyclohydrolase 1 type 2 homolog n=1 Tax=Candidatus Desulfatibia profunda TaxID=2841695 RepID=A0A8J6NYA9_9BACT|nr:Nif3-like dinuclear metal center hexameric protein [Candidatus Desulfatibia profunda]MBL7180474.1 Nif3-like dinuclear metal center hexameric protein [Desulfobacterales bacterium]